MKRTNLQIALDNVDKANIKGDSKAYASATRRLGEIVYEKSLNWRGEGTITARNPRK